MIICITHLKNRYNILINRLNFHRSLWSKKFPNHRYLIDGILPNATEVQFIKEKENLKTKILIVLTTVVIKYSFKRHY